MMPLTWRNLTLHTYALLLFDAATNFNSLPEGGLVDLSLSDQSRCPPNIAVQEARYHVVLVLLLQVCTSKSTLRAF